MSQRPLSPSVIGARTGLNRFLARALVFLVVALALLWVRHWRLKHESAFAHAAEVDALNRDLLMQNASLERQVADLELAQADPPFGADAAHEALAACLGWSQGRVFVWKKLNARWLLRPFRADDLATGGSLRAPGRIRSLRSGSGAWSVSVATSKDGRESLTVRHLDQGPRFLTCPLAGHRFFFRDSRGVHLTPI